MERDGPVVAGTVKSPKRRASAPKAAVEDSAVAVLDPSSLVELLDQLSTRLIIDGVASLAPADFEQLSAAAADTGYTAVATAAHELAEKYAASSGVPLPEVTRLLSWGLENARKLLREPSASADVTNSAGLSVDPAADVPSLKVLASDEGLVREFITESREHLTAIESNLLVLERDNTASATLNVIFGGFHTIKGLAGFLEFGDIQSLAHEVETLLDLARTGRLAVTPAVVDVVLESTDVVGKLLAVIAETLDGKSPAPVAVDEALLARIRQTASGNAPAESTPSAADAPQVETKSQAKSVPQTADASALQTETAEPKLKEPTPKPSATHAVPTPAAPKEETAADARQRSTGESSSVRIDTAKLDQLMDMVGEMVIAQTLIGHSPALASVTDAALHRSLNQLARITADVQRITTGMRMVPIGTQFQKSARLVRDLARRAGKQIAFEASGEDTELDKTIAEQLADPLLHMVRNSIDHGIESPAERVAAGKDPTARIRVSASHRSGQIVVSISDDGRGLNREKIIAKALANGLIQSESQVVGDEIFQLIFEPGFSTAEKITDISGRGVGMDVVRRNVQKLRGRIEVQSRGGEGTTITIVLPLTLAIIEGLVVMVGAHRYIVPIFSVREMFRPSPEMLSTVQGRGEMALVRGTLMPIVRLHNRFSVEPRSCNFTDGTLIVAESESRPFCLFVDDLVGKQEVVIKSLGEKFQDVAGLAGCAILGDGRVGLILDLDGIYKGRN